MVFNHMTTASAEFVAGAVDLVLIIANFSGHRRNIRVFLYQLSMIFMFLATVVNMMWNLSGTATHSEFIGKGMMVATYVLSYVGTAFIGYYLVAVIDARKKIPAFYSMSILTVSLIGIFYVFVGSLNNTVFYYEDGNIYNGPLFVAALYLVIALGACDVIIIVTHMKILGLRDALVTLAYFALPMTAVLLKIADDSLDCIFPAVAISELIVNNMLLTKEKFDADNAAYLAQRAAQNKSNFLANMSHEIRTPINAVIGLNELILRESKEPDILSYAKDVSSSSKQLLSLVNDILDFSKIEAGKMEIVPVSYRFATLINDVVNMIGVKAEQKNLKFIVDVNKRLPDYLSGDDIRLRQIIINILSNAVKYTKQGSILFTAEFEKLTETEIMLTISVKDTGVGMKPEDIEKLYQPFQRIDEDHNRNIEGTGLGMAITQSYLKLMGSKLEVSSVYGTGSLFSFSVVQKVENWKPIGDFEAAMKDIHKQHEKYAAKMWAPDAKILVVDDKVMNIKVVRGLLKETGIQIDDAISGDDALEMLSKKEYDILLLDHMMPGKSGIDTIKILRSDAKSPNKDIKAIALTANAVSGARKMYIDAGFDDYLTKPIDPESLEDMLINFLPKKMLGKQEKENDIPEALQQESEQPKDAMSMIRDIAEIDVAKGVEASYGDNAIFLMAVEQYCIDYEGILQLIDQYHAEKNAYEYTVQVHGLKSMSRQIGAVELGDMAYALEMAGKEEDWTKIDADTDTLVNRTRAFGELLKKIPFEA